jgi:prolyl oligopeptidase PreP (S9A serine peptidase family)
LAGIGWGWYRRDISAGSMVAIMGGSIGGMLIIAVAFATWILMGFPVS